MIPERAIYTATDLKGFINSAAYKELNTFILKCSYSVCGFTNSDVRDSTPERVAVLSAFLLRLANLTDSFPPLEQSMRFGNKAFRNWHTELKKEIPLFLNHFLPIDKLEYAEELGTYLAYSFGNEIRLDYGTGHETFFVVFLYCLSKLDVIERSDYKAVFYLLEPAGSHGVWGLDDYQCLVFLWGAAQLKDHPDLKPSSIHDESVLAEYQHEYLYFDAIRFIRHIKHGAPFAETSPMLNDISFLENWGKVFNGLLRLYDGEVLNKFPVSQHLLFGSIFSATWTKSTELERVSAARVGPVGVPFGLPTRRPVSGETAFTRMSAPHARAPLVSNRTPEQAEFDTNSGLQTAAPWASNNHDI